MKREQAQKELEKLRQEEWLEVLLREVGALPATVRTLGRGLLGRQPDDKKPSNWKTTQEAQRRAVVQLGKESVGQRQKLFETLFPKLGSEVEAAYHLNQRLPYQIEYNRKAFRTPHHPEFTRYRTFAWLDTLSQSVGGYSEDVVWWSAWAGHCDEHGADDALGVLFATAIDAGGKTGDAVFDILCASGRNEHEIGCMGRHVSRGLLIAGRPDGWEFMEKMLLAAQRQEGLRQSILESIDEAHPDAFRRMLRLIREHDLARFSSVVRAVDVWFGFQWDSVSTRVVNNALELVLTYFDDEDARRKAVQKGDGDDLYLALWTLAFEDAMSAIDVAVPLLTDKNVKRRFIATHLLVQLALPAAKEALLTVLDDEDLRVAWRAAPGFFESYDDDEAPLPKNLFERLEKLLERLPAKGADLKSLVWPWMGTKARPGDVVGWLVDSLGERPTTRLIPYLPRMDTWAKQNVVKQLAEQKKWDVETRTTLFRMVGDTSAEVRESAVEALAKCKIDVGEAEQLEKLLTRKANDLRRGVLALLLKQKDVAALASADRLLIASDGLQRLAGLEILRELAAAKRQPEQCRARADQFRQERPRVVKEEQRFFDAIADAGQDRPTLDNALGLLDPAERSRPIAPKKRLDKFFTPAVFALVQSLDDHIHQHREQEVIIKRRPVIRDPDDEDDEDDEDEFDELDDEESEKLEVQLLGEIEYGFPHPDARLPIEEDLAYLPLAELWQSWWRDRPAAARDKDGLEALRALALLKKIDEEEWWDDLSAPMKKTVKTLFGDTKVKRLRYAGIMDDVLAWLLRIEHPPGVADFLLDAVETSYAHVPAEELARSVDLTKESWDRDDDDADWRGNFGTPMTLWQNLVGQYRRICPADWTSKHHVRLYQLQNWKDLSTPGMGRNRPGFDEVLEAYKAGGATRADLLDLILGPPDADSYNEFSHLSDLTARKPRVSWLKDRPELKEMVEACRRRILEVELQRGETPTAASAAALGLESVWGVDTLFRVLQALGKDKLHRGYSFDENQGKSCVLTHLLAVCYPTDEETPEDFAAKIRAAEVGEERLIALAFKAPQWVKFVEHTLGWDGFAEAVWWFLAHTRDSEQEIDKAWKALMSERTALSAAELREGAVDVAWFHRAHAALGAKRWPALDEAAKFASQAGGYRRAQFLASVLLGNAKRATLIADIKKKHLKESVRALGLLPLAAGRDADLNERYQVLQEYHRYARALSPMSREAAVKSAEVGLANLARTAGYPDPIRFQWAMEAASCADLLEGVSARAGDVEVTLGVDAEGQVQWNVLRKGKSVKSVPGPQKKDKKIAALVDRKKELSRSQGRMRRGLEDMMCRGDVFSAAEFVQLMQHPLLAPMLHRLLVKGEGILGYPEKKGQALRDHAGKLEPVKKSETLRLAHPCDLLESGAWNLWQHDCFRRELVQPFKQVFRELYVPAGAEKKETRSALRGQQVQPRQATALWASRGWSTGHDDGIGKAFHDLGLIATVGFQDTAGTAAEVEGWTLETVDFARLQDHKPVKLSEVPPRLFSEVMRDMDLVVSVAHRGGVDPEASASTIEMRANLLRELCLLLKLGNVRQQKQHILIDGQLGNYSVHLGSGGVHRLPGGAVCILPVHAQHRGRLFLPFADDDPKSAEILSKVLLLARDQDIQDPSILDQLPGG